MTVVRARMPCAQALDATQAPLAEDIPRTEWLPPSDWMTALPSR
jgi:hypothetical protein